MSQQLVLSQQYMDLLHNTNDSDVKDWLGDKLKVAQNTVSSLEMRNSTLLACTSQIVQHQSAFFLGIENTLRPYSQAALAESLELNPSTISRALNGKYLQCEQGVFPLSYFFPAAVETFNDAVASSSADVINLLRDLVEREDKASPLSDSDLQSMLEAEGIKISRRTVANYRKRLNIPSAVLRKK